MRAGTLPRYGGGYFSLGKNIYPQPPRGRVRSEPVELICEEDAAGLGRELELALRLIAGHDQVGKLHIHKALGLFHLLRSVTNAGIDIDKESSFIDIGQLTGLTYGNSCVADIQANDIIAMLNTPLLLNLSEVFLLIQVSCVLAIPYMEKLQ